MSLDPRLQPSALFGEVSATVGARKDEVIELGWPGLCPGRPRLILPNLDDSGSVALPGGGDPVGNRYGEIRLAFEALQAWCTCRRCLAGVLHFDTPDGDVDPGRLGSANFQRQLARGLQEPGGGGTSLLGPSLDRAHEIAAQYPKHEVRLVILTDWELFDSDGYIQRLLDFPGTVLAIGLNATPPEALSSDSVASLRINHGDKPGAVARALFGELTVGRRGRRSPATTRAGTA